MTQSADSDASSEKADDGVPSEPEQDAAERFELIYDLAELRRRIEVSFTAGELSKFAEPLRIYTDREGASAKGAKTLVTAMQARGRLDDLVKRLAKHKPLIEWPEPQKVPAGQAPPSELHEDEESDPQIEDPAVPSDAPPPSASVFRRSLLLAGMLGLGALLGVVGLRLLAPAPTQTPAERVTRIELAELAAGHLGQAVAAVARACLAEDTSATAREALTNAFRNCAGPPPAEPSDRSRTVPDPLLIGTRRPARRPYPAPRPRRRTADNDRRCLDSCNRAHTACRRDRCGPEPVGGRQFAAYRRCTSSCLASNSKCRLRCH